jgi:hypothetical protein
MLGGHLLRGVGTGIVRLLCLHCTTTIAPKLSYVFIEKNTRVQSIRELAFVLLLTLIQKQKHMVVMTT